MDIKNNVSPSFGSIQVRLSKMNRTQIELSDRLYRTLKYDAHYSKIADNDLDLYMLPAKTHDSIEIRYMDPFSGNFVRDEQGKIMRENLSSLINSKVEKVTDAVVDTYNKILNNVIKRPKEDLSQIVSGKTDIARVNPTKQEDLFDIIEELKVSGYSKEDAEQQAFEDFKSLYHVDNHDADF